MHDYVNWNIKTVGKFTLISIAWELWDDKRVNQPTTGATAKLMCSYSSDLHLPCRVTISKYNKFNEGQGSNKTEEAEWWYRSRHYNVTLNLL